MGKTAAAYQVHTQGMVLRQATGLLLLLHLSTIPRCKGGTPARGNKQGLSVMMYSNNIPSIALHEAR
jgi:hypothetical protein